MIAEPPFEPGAVHESDTAPLPNVGVSPVGAEAGIAGVYGPTWLDALPDPTEFTAETRNRYSVPFCRLVTVAVVAVEVPSENVLHVAAATVLNSTM